MKPRTSIATPRNIVDAPIHATSRTALRGQFPAAQKPSAICATPASSWNHHIELAVRVANAATMSNAPAATKKKDA